MANEQQFEFNLGAMLESQGLAFVDTPTEGTAIVRDQEGQEQELDITGLVTSLGLDLANTDIIYNTPDKPVQMSPLSIAERGALKGLGNAKGVMNHLIKSERFDKVASTKDGLVVLENGKWKALDPGLMATIKSGDPWQIAKEFASDIADIAPVGLDIAAMAGGAVEGAAIGSAAGPVGAIGGAIIGAGAGGFAASRLRTSLGRIVGTYDATPEEEIRDNAMDTVIAMGGQALGPGARLGWDKLGKAMQGLKNTAAGDLVATVYGRLTGVGTGAMRTMMDRTTQVTNAMKRSISQAGPKASTDTAIDVASRNAIDSTKTLLDDSISALPNQWGRLYQNLLQRARNKAPEIDMQEMGLRVGRELEERGFGKIEVIDAAAKSRGNLQSQILQGREKVQQLLSRRAELKKLRDAKLDALSQGKEGIGQGKTLADLTNESKKIEFELNRLQRGLSGKLKQFSAEPKKPRLQFRSYTDDEAAALAQRGIEIESLSSVEEQAINRALKSINRRMSAGRLRGDKSAKALTGLQKEINQIERDLAQKKLVSSPAVARAVSRINDAVRGEVRDRFNAAGLGREHKAMSDIYKKFADSVNSARRITNNGSSVESLTSRLTSDAGRNLSPKGMAQDLVELLGPKGQSLYNNIVVNSTAAKFLPWAPKFGLLQAGVVGGGVAGSLTNPATLAATATVGTQFSPRIVANQASLFNAMTQMNTFVKALPEAGRLQLVGNRAALSSMLRSAADSVRMEQQLIDEILGLPNGQNQ